MRRLTVTVMFAMAISAAMRADDAPKTIPLHESLKELEWLVGHWRSATESGEDLNKHFARPEDNLVLNFLVFPASDGKTLHLTYEVSVRYLGEFIRAKIDETIVPDAETGGFRGKYEWSHRSGDVKMAGKGQYSLKKTGGNIWTGDQSSTFAFVSPTGLPEKSGHCAIILKRHDEHFFSVRFTNRVDMPTGKDEVVVYLAREQKDKK